MPTSAADAEHRTPMKPSLRQNHPNPFNSETVIRFALAQSGQVKIAIYNITGRRIKRVVDAAFQPGEHAVVWDGKDENGRSVQAGIYFCRINAGIFGMTRKMILAK